jgi:hypothetical protein
MVSATSTTLPDMMNCEGSAPEGRGRSFAWLFLAAWRMWRTRQCANGAPNAIYRRASASISVHQRASVQVRHERALEGAPNVHQRCIWYVRIRDA